MNVTDEIKARIDIVDFISRYVPLQRSGSTFKACCPFHQEKTPSFVVFPHTGTWHCFGACGTGGDVFTFLMKKENLDFSEALKVLAKEAGVELAPPEADPGASQRELLYQINSQAAAYFRNLLHRHSAAAPAREYLQRRGIHKDVAELFQLGFALNSWDNLRNHLLEQGFSDEQLQKAGLLKYNEQRNRYYDAFRNRLIIPIRDRQGRVIGFGGRVLDDSLPKYLNTGETPLFHKSRVVFGLDLAHRAIREADEVIIVEGYMDVIAAHQHGYTNVVACMGTAITQEQLQQLQRFTTNFVLALDADAAGQQATIRGLNQARQALRQLRKPVFSPGGRMRLEERLAANLRIVALPQGMDPDDLIRSQPGQWEELIRTAQPLVDYFFDLVQAQYDLATAQGKAQAVAQIAPLIAELGDEIERQHYIQRLSRLVQIDEQTIQHRVEAAARTLARPAKRSSRRPPLPGASSPELPPEDALEVGSVAMAQGATPASSGLASTASSRLAMEKFLLANLLPDPRLLIWLVGAADRLEIQPLVGEDLDQPEYREIFRALKRYISRDEPWDLEAFQSTLAPELHGWLAQLVSYAATLPQREPDELREALLKVMIRLRLERLKTQLTSMHFLLRDAQQAKEREAILRYSTAINRNRRERHHLQQLLVQLNRTLLDSNRLSQGAPTL